MRQLKKKGVIDLVNTELLREKIARRNMTVSDVAAEMNIDKATLYRRIAAPESFTIGEALKISELLELHHSDSIAIFFAQPVA